MKEYLKKLRKLLTKYSKAEIAVKLGIGDTRTIDGWLRREMIPSKYLDQIKEIK